MKYVARMLMTGAALAVIGAAQAQADAIDPAGGWDQFLWSTGDPGPTQAFDQYGNYDFTFTLTQAQTLKVTDAFFTGDQFQLTINGVLQAPTSQPAFNTDYTDNFDTAFSNPNYSHASYLLGPGTYVVDINVVIPPGNPDGAYLPYTGGVGGIELGAAPEPAIWALMTLAVGGMGAALRTRRRKAVAA